MSIFTDSDQRLDHDLVAERCRRSLRLFVRGFWHVLEPGKPLLWGKHIEAICDHLQAITEGEIDKLIINIPPGMAKSLLVAVFWNAWTWTIKPDVRWLFGSYDSRLSLRDSDRCRTLINSYEYQELFNPDWHILKTTNAKGFYVNSAFGHRFSFGMNSHFKTGWRGDIVVVDDPLSADDQYDPRIKKECLDTWNNSISTRVNDPNTAAFLVIMQRLAVDDLTGAMLEEGGWDHLCLPAEYDSNRKASTSIGWQDWRTEEGELLFPPIYPKERLDFLREKKLGSVGYAGQFQQRPVPAKGGRFELEYFRKWTYVEGTENRIIRLWHRDGSSTPIRIDLCQKFVSVDVAVSEKTTADFTVYFLYARTKSNQLIFLNRWKDRMTEPASIKLAKDIYQFPTYGLIRPSYFAVEANGVGGPCYQQMQDAGIPVLPVHVVKDKMAMSVTIAVRMEAGDVFFPADEHAAWMPDCRETLLNFPAAAHDDDVTGVSIAGVAMYGDEEGEMQEAGGVRDETDRRKAHEVVGGHNGHAGGRNGNGTADSRRQRAKIVGPRR